MQWRCIHSIIHRETINTHDVVIRNEADGKKLNYKFEYSLECMKSLVWTGFFFSYKLFVKLKRAAN